MPAVNLPPQEAHGNVTLYPGPGAQLRLLYRTTPFIHPFIHGLLFLGVLLVLRIILKRNYKSSSHASSSWTSEEKSSQFNFVNDTMSTNQPSGDYSYTSTTEGLGDEGKRGSRDGSKERENGEALNEEINTSVNINAGTPLILKFGPPPPLPLTPPTLLTDSLTSQDHRLSTAMSSVGNLDTSSQPNPDYTGSNSTSTASTHGHDVGYPSIPLLGPGYQADSEHDGAASFLSSSFPHESLDSGVIHVEGEMVSVPGTGWLRHTSVYDGGPCLACQAAGSEGGFYGENVPPEHRR